MGVAHTGAIGPTTDDPALCIQLADGTMLAARRRRGTRYFFVLPPGQERVVLRSRAAVPSSVEGAFVDDRRQLGICVRGATLWNDLRSTALPLGHGGQPGWYAPEHQDGACWTDGGGALDLPVLTRLTMLEIDVAATARYVLCEQASLRRA